MIDQKTIRLLIEAQLKGGKDLESITKSITELEAAIDKQSAAAKRGESSIDQLKSSLEALKVVQRELEQRANLVGSFQKASEAIGRTEERVTKAVRKYEEFKQKIAETGTATAAQQKKLDSYSLAIDRANVALDKQKERQQTATKALADAGVSITGLAAEEDRLRAATISLGSAFQRVQGAITSYGEDVRKAKEAERALADEQNRVIQQEQKRIGVINAQIAAARKRAEDAAAAQKAIQVRDTGLRKAADEADAAARGYTSLARASDNLRPKQASLREAIDGIINPSEKVRSTLNGVEQEVNQLASAIAKIKGPVTDYRATVDALVASQKSVAQQAGLIDNFRRQTEQLRAARSEYAAARAQVTEYAAAVRQGGEAGAAFTKSLAEAQNRARSAAQALAAQLATTRQARDVLRAAGVATNNLNAETERLTRTAQSAVSATNGLAAAVKKYGVETDRASKFKNPFSGEGGRTTLSYLQRIRGEVLALTTAYVGLFGVVRAGQGAIDATQVREGARNQLSISVGNDAKAIDAEYAYVKAQSDRIGLEFDRAIKGYAKFSASAALAGRSRQEIRFIYESFAEVARVANVSADELDGVFKALSDIFSKGKLQAEELRGQLGDRLFGAFQIAAQALKDQFPDLNKAMEKGLVTSDQLVLVANKYRDTVANQLPQATQSLAAQQARLNNAMFDFRLAIGDAGFIDAYTRALKQLTEFLRSEDGQQFATNIGKAFAGAADGVVYLLKNLETVKTVLQVVAGYFAAALGVSVVRTIIAGGKAVKDLAVLLVGLYGTVQKFAVAFPKLFSGIAGGLGLVLSVFAGWKLGEYLNDKYELVRKFGVALVTGFAELWVKLKVGFEVVMAALPGIASNVMRALYNTVADFIRKGLSLFSLFAKAAGLDGLAKSIDDAANSLRIGYVDIGKATEQARRKMEQEVENIRGIRDDMMKAAERPLNQPGNSRAGGGRGFVNPPLVQGGTTAFPGRLNGNAKAETSESEINKRQRQIEEITRALESLDAKIDRSQTETLAKQLSAIDTQYAALERKIKNLGGAESKAFMAQLTSLTNELRKVTTDKFNDALVKEQMALQNKLEDLDATAGRKEKLSLEARQNAIRLQYADLYRELADLRLKFFNNDRDTSEMDAAKARLDAGVQELVNLEAKKFAQEELNRKQERYNKLVQARDAQIAAVRARQETGVIDQDQAAAEINTINSQVIPAINAAAEATRQWALANKQVFATPEDLAIFLANLEATRVKATEVTQEMTRMEAVFVQGGIDAINTGLNAVVDNLQKVVTGQISVKEGFKGILVSLGQFVAQFLRDIAVMIAKLIIFRWLASQGGILGTIGKVGLAGMGVKHEGGVIGVPGGRTRDVSPAWFANAPRYHSGGLVGLKADEYPTILQRGEEVLAADSPRNIMNGGAGVGGAPAPSTNGVKFVLVDDRQKVPEAMNTAEGDQVIVQAIRRNASTLKQFMK